MRLDADTEILRAWEIWILHYTYIPFSDVSIESQPVL